VSRWDRLAGAIALLFAVLPLWVSRHLPMVDLPQHLHLISVLHRIDDPTTIYPKLFAVRAELTPYLGYYYAVSFLNWLLPIEVANKLFLSAYVIGMPLGLAFLLRSLGRPSWPSLLAVPFAYGDSFAWGFVNYCSALPLAFFSCGLVVRAISDQQRRRAWAIWLAVTLVLTLLFHVQVFAFVVLAFLALLLTPRPPEDARSVSSFGSGGHVTRHGSAIPEGAGRSPNVPAQDRNSVSSFGPGRAKSIHTSASSGQVASEAPAAHGVEMPPATKATTFDSQRWRALLAVRVPSLLAALPAAVLFAVWVVGRVGQPTEVEYGAPWKAWGPLLSSSNLSFKSFTQNREEFFAVLANMLRDGSDRYALYAVGIAAAAAVVLGAWPAMRQATGEGPIERWRILGLGAIALALYFLLPFDIRGYMYYLNTRYAHLAAALLVCAVPPLRAAAGRILGAAAVACAILLGLVLAQGFTSFGREAAAVDRLAPSCPPAALIMGLIFNPSSAVVRHPVYLHSAATLALERGGATNFSFARTQHSPIRYRGSPPPTFPSEWRPDQFDFARQGGAYDAFLVRGAAPAQIFGPLLGSQLEPADQADSFHLVRRR